MLLRGPLYHGHPTSRPCWQSPPLERPETWSNAGGPWSKRSCRRARSRTPLERRHRGCQPGCGWNDNGARFPMWLKPNVSGRWGGILTEHLDPDRCSTSAVPVLDARGARSCPPLPRPWGVVAAADPSAVATAPPPLKAASRKALSGLPSRRLGRLAAPTSCRPPSPQSCILLENRSSTASAGDTGQPAHSPPWDHRC